MINQFENADHNTPIWSWLLRAYSSVKSWILWLYSCVQLINNTKNLRRVAVLDPQALVVSRSATLESFSRLPDVLLQHISSFLPFFRRASMACMSHASNALYQKDLLSEKFSYLVGVDGEDNQNKAEAMLRQYPKWISAFIAGQKTVIDAAGRFFPNPMSAYAYTFWAGDTRMGRMMERFMDENTKASVFKECKNIHIKGVDFMFKGKRINNSKHFDFQSIIDAYTAYIVAATPLINANNWNYEAWMLVDEFWINIGKELAKIPTHVAQEYCANQSFAPRDHYVTSLKNPSLIRTVEFHNWLSGDDEYWFVSGRVNPNLGVLFSIYKGPSGTPFGTIAHGVEPRVDHDLAAIIALCEERIVNDRNQTFDNLNQRDR